MNRFRVLVSILSCAATTRQELQEDPEGKVESIVPKIDHEFYDPIEVRPGTRRVIRSYHLTMLTC